jgi:hypothetical protein
MRAEKRARYAREYTTAGLSVARKCAGCCFFYCARTYVRYDRALRARVLSRKYLTHRAKSEKKETP